MKENAEIAHSWILGRNIPHLPKEGQKPVL